MQTASITLESVSLEVDYYYTPGTPARTHGHPDNWAPAEGGDLEYAVLVGDQDITALLADWATKHIAEKCLEHYKQMLAQAEEDVAADAAWDADYVERHL